MAENVITGGNEYEIGKIDVFKQLFLVKRILPIAGALFDSFKESASATDGGFEEKILGLIAGSLPNALKNMSDEDLEFIAKTCLSACKRNDRGWHPVMKSGTLMYQDVGMDTVIALSVAVIKENILSLFPTGQPASAEPK